MDRQQRSDFISDLCDQAGCTDERRKRHHRLFVEEQWNPHPAPVFVEWIKTVEPFVNVFSAYNTRYYRNLYVEAQQVGAA